MNFATYIGLHWQMGGRWRIVWITHQEVTSWTISPWNTLQQCHYALLLYTCDFKLMTITECMFIQVLTTVTNMSQMKLEQCYQFSVVRALFPEIFYSKYMWLKDSVVSRNLTEISNCVPLVA